MTLFNFTDNQGNPAQIGPFKPDAVNPSVSPEEMKKAAEDMIKKAQQLLDRLGDQDDGEGEGDGGGSPDSQKAAEAAMKPKQAPRKAVGFMMPPLKPADFEHVKPSPHEPGATILNGREVDWKKLNNEQKFKADQETKAANMARARLGQGPMQKEEGVQDDAEKAKNFFLAAKGEGQNAPAPQDFDGNPLNQGQIDQIKAALQAEGLLPDLQAADQGDAAAAAAVQAGREVVQQKAVNGEVVGPARNARGLGKAVPTIQLDFGDEGAKQAANWGGGGVAIPDELGAAAKQKLREEVEAGNARHQEMVNKGLIKEVVNFNPALRGGAQSRGINPGAINMAAQQHAILEAGPVNHNTINKKDGLFFDDIQKMQNIKEIFADVDAAGEGDQDLTKPQKINNVGLIKKHKTRDAFKKVHRNQHTLAAQENPRGGVFLGKKGNAANSLLMAPPLAKIPAVHNDTPRFLCGCKPAAQRKNIDQNPNLRGRIIQDFKDAGIQLSDAQLNGIRDNMSWSAAPAISTDAISPDNFSLRKRDYNVGTNKARKLSVYKSASSGQNIGNNLPGMQQTVVTVDGQTRTYRIPADDIQYDQNVCGAANSSAGGKKNRYRPTVNNLGYLVDPPVDSSADRNTNQRYRGRIVTCGIGA